MNIIALQTQIRYTKIQAEIEAIPKGALDRKEFDQRAFEFGSWKDPAYARTERARP